MSVSLSELQRGAVCIALYPFTPGFPLDVVLREIEAQGDLNAKIEAYDSIEAISRKTHREIVVEFKLRPVLLLHTGTSDQRPDVLAARINSITEDQRVKRRNWVLQLENGIHPIMMLVGDEGHHGLNSPSYINPLSIQPVNKKAILRCIGQLTENEMAAVSERLIRTLEIDVSAYVARLAPGLISAQPSSEPEQPS